MGSGMDWFYDLANDLLLIGLLALVFLLLAIGIALVQAAPKLVRAQMRRIAPWVLRRAAHLEEARSRISFGPFPHGHNRV